MKKIWIDADGCPVTKQAAAIAKEQNIPCVIVTDIAHQFNIPGTEVITVSKGADYVDFKLVNSIGSGDIVVTQDYGLAAMVLAKQGIPIDQNGRIYDEHNIDSLLNSRAAAAKIRRGGGRIKGPKKRKKEQDQVFVTALIKLIKKQQL